MTYQSITTNKSIEDIKKMIAENTLQKNNSFIHLHICGEMRAEDKSKIAYSSLVTQSHNDRFDVIKSRFENKETTKYLTGFINMLLVMDGQISRIIDLPEGKVEVSKAGDIDGNPILKFSAEKEASGVNCTMTVGFGNADSRNNAFVFFSTEEAERFFNHVHGFITNA